MLLPYILGKNFVERQAYENQKKEKTKHFFQLLGL